MLRAALLILMLAAFHAAGCRTPSKSTDFDGDKTCRAVFSACLANCPREFKQSGPSSSNADELTEEVWSVDDECAGQCEASYEECNVFDKEGRCGRKHSTCLEDCGPDHPDKEECSRQCDDALSSCMKKE